MLKYFNNKLIINTLNVIKGILLPLFILLFSFSINAQYPPNEISYKVLMKSINDSSESINAHLQLGYYFAFRGKNIDSAYYFISTVNKQKEKLNPRQKATLLNLTGKYYLDQSNLDSANVYFNNSLKLASNIDYKEVIADNRNGKAAIAIYSSNYTDAITELIETVKILELLGNKEELAMCEYNIGMFYTYIKNYEKAKKYQFKSIERLKKIGGKTNQQAMRYGALCNVFLKEKKIDSAMYCISKITDNGDEKYNNYFYYRGEIALAKKENDSAILNYKKSLNLLGENYRNKELAIRHNKIAQAYLNLNSSNKALANLKKADSLIINNSFPTLRRKQDSLYFKAYEQLDDSKNALLYLKKYQESANKSLPISKIQAANNIENSYQVKKKELVILNQKEAIKVYLSQNKWLFYIALLGFLGFVLFFVLNYYNKKKLRNEKAYIAFQYKELNSNNLALNDKLSRISEKLALSDKKVKPLRYKTSSLSSVQRKEYMKLILDYAIENKPYLNSELTQKELAKQLNIATHHLSEVLNINFGKNFYSFINLYRVEEAKKIMISDTENLTMLAIAYNAGFNSKASFNRVFKGVTGVTPTSFKKNR